MLQENTYMSRNERLSRNIHSLQPTTNVRRGDTESKATKKETIIMLTEKRIHTQKPRQQKVEQLCVFMRKFHISSAAPCAYVRVYSFSQWQMKRGECATCAACACAQAKPAWNEASSNLRCQYHLKFDETPMRRGTEV